MITLADWYPTRYQKKLVKSIFKTRRLTYGDLTREFESQFAETQGWDHALFTSSGTDALKIAIGAFKDKYSWQDGDEIIIPAVTFIATLNAVVMNNLTPVLVDVDLQTVNIDPDKIKAAITPKARAIIPVHLLGLPADMPAIMKIAKKYKLKVIEDSCETMFVDYEPKGDLACYSTYIAHLLVTGVGGFITTNDKKLADTMRSMMFHGRDESYLNIDDTPDPNKHYSFPRFGYSDRLTEFEAALGLGELRDSKKYISIRQDNARYLTDQLTQITGIGFPVYHYSAFMFYPIYVKERDELARWLDLCGVQTRHIMPLTTQPLVKQYIKGELKSADLVNENGLLLPCHQYLKKKDLKYMVDCAKEFYEER